MPLAPDNGGMRDVTSCSKPLSAQDQASDNCAGLLGTAVCYFQTGCSQGVAFLCGTRSGKGPERQMVCPGQTGVLTAVPPRQWL